MLAKVSDTCVGWPDVIVAGTFCETKAASLTPTLLPTCMATLVDAWPKGEAASLATIHWKLYVPAVVGAMAWKVRLSCWPGRTTKGVSSTVLPPQVVLFGGFCEINRSPPSEPSQTAVPVFVQTTVARKVWPGDSVVGTLCETNCELNVPPPGELTVMDSALFAIPWAESRTCTVKLAVAAVVGVPVIAPVVAFN